MQYEVTVGAAIGVTAADEAVAVREIARAVACRLGSRVSFTPILRPDAVGNGVHMHFSLIDARTEAPVNYDADQAHGLSAQVQSFLAGMLAKLPAITVLTAASSISYLRLTPNRWSAAYNNLGYRDREAGVRICPVFATDEAATAKQFHFEFRAADAAASPYLALGAILAAGLHGLDRKLPTPKVTESAPQNMSEKELKALDIVRLPQSLGDALDLFEAENDLTESFGQELKSAYIAHKRFEAEMMAKLTPAEQCEKYRLAY
jgi:glutamine synthetase